MATTVFDLMATLGLDTSKYEEGLNGVKAKGTEIGSAIGSGLMSAAKIGAAAIGTATVAVAGLSKEALSSYANYEQLEGGVKKLYGNMGLSVEEYAVQNKKSVSEVQSEWQNLEKAQQDVLNNAQNAYKTAGMSANQYMEIATSFSASLINSLGGDTVKAAEKTDVAMKAISDNFNTFGGDIGMIQGAFQGFAKQNYTMLDNLKLGYGGTKTEMERLIKDANEWAKANGEAADLSIDSFADVVTAIDYIQQKQQIAGTTAREAMTTIEGSANATKAAWEDVITAIGRGEGIKEAFDGLVSSIFGEEEGQGLLNQIIPRIQTVFDGIASFVETAGPIFAEKIPVLIESVLPEILNSASILITSLADGLISSLPIIFETGTQIMMNLVESILSLLPKIGEVAIQTLIQFATSIGEAAPTIIPDAVNAIIDTILVLLENVDALVDGAIALVTGLADGIINALPILIERLPEIIVKIIEALILAAPKLMTVGPQLILSLITGIIQSIPKLLTMGPRLVGELVTTLIQDAPRMIDGGIEQVKKLIEGIVQMIPDLLTLPADIVTQLVAVFVEQGEQLFQTGADLVTKIGEGFSSVIDQAFQWGADLIDNFIGGILDNVDALMDTVSDIADSISSMLGFSEPKKGPLSNFHTYAPDMMKLFAEGIKNNTDLVTDQIADSFDFEDAITNGASDIRANTDVNRGNGFIQNLTINSPKQLDPSEIARQTRNANREFVLQLRTV